MNKRDTIEFMNDRIAAGGITEALDRESNYYLRAIAKGIVYLVMVSEPND